MQGTQKRSMTLKSDKLKTLLSTLLFVFFLLVLLLPASTRMADTLIPFPNPDIHMFQWYHWQVGEDLLGLFKLNDWQFFPVGFHPNYMYGFFLHPILFKIMFSPGNLALVINLIIILQMLLAFWGAYLSARELGYGRVSAWFSGALFALSPYAMTELAIGALDTAAVWGLAWIFFLCVRFSRSRSYRILPAIAGVWVFTLISSIYYGISGAILILWIFYAYLPDRENALERRRTMLGAAGLIVLFGLAIAIIYPFIIDVQGMERSQFFTEPAMNDGPGLWPEAVKNSIHFWPPLAYSSFLPHQGHAPITGFIGLSLGLIGLYGAKKHRKLLGIGALIFFIMALGPYLKLGNASSRLTLIPSLMFPLFQFMPGFSRITYPVHFFVPGILMLALAAGHTIDRVLKRIGNRRLPAFIGGFFVLFLADTLILCRGPIAFTGSPVEAPRWTIELKSRPVEAVVFLPIYSNMLLNSQYIAWQGAHGKKMFNGLFNPSVGAPKKWVEILRDNPFLSSAVTGKLRPDATSPGALEYLKELGIDAAVADLGELTPELTDMLSTWPRRSERLSGDVWIFYIE